MERSIRHFEMKSKMFVVLFLFQVVLSKAVVDEILDDAKLDFPGLAKKYGLPCEEYDFTTEDGYILKTFHIPGNKSKPFLVIHAMMDTSDTLLIRGRKSLGYTLHKAGYDIWSYNFRGNKYSRRHVTLNPDTDKAFWDFSMHEHGVYDLPAAIDLVLNQTGRSQLALLGYSEGTVLMFILGSIKPEYNDKVNIFVAMTPICYLHHLPKHMPLVTPFAEMAAPIILGLNIEELLNHDSVISVLIRNVCGRNPHFCINFLNILGEIEHNSIDAELMRVFSSHYPAGTSRKNLQHYHQVMLSKKFAQYDYGPEKNLIKYESRKPPSYNLNNVTVKTALFIAGTDILSTKDDVALLVKELPNIVYYKEFDKMNHITLGYSRYSYKKVFPYVLMILEKYT